MIPMKKTKRIEIFSNLLSELDAIVHKDINTICGSYGARVGGLKECHAAHIW